jgi:hypothetical protein
VGRIFRAKYYHGGSFLEAKMGSRPSFAWRSVLVAWELLKEGLQWRVSDGKKKHKNLAKQMDPMIDDICHTILLTFAAN